LGNTALHYATQMWPQTVVRSLLEIGANIGLKNIYEEVAINRILPEVMEDFLNDYCLTSEGNVTNENFKITAKFDFLVPFGTNEVS
jgi:ankyrin repeat protein